MVAELSAQTRQIVTTLRSRDAIPRHFQLSKIGAYSAVAAFNAEPTDIIDEKVFTGMHLSAEVALQKCLSEMIERKAVEQWIARNPTFGSWGSDGFAAFPRSLENAQDRARANAWLEAVERYAWARWWDDPGCIAEINCSPVFADIESSIVDEIRKSTPLSSLIQIQPMVEKGPIVRIFFGRLKSGGYISGGAAGQPEDSDLNVRSLYELFRHSQAARRLVGLKKTLSSYEGRLMYFANGHGNSLVESRLSTVGSKRICLGPLQIDEAIEHSFNDLYVVHKCQFVDQPAFLGGALERLCL
jgi:hypothetical protein